MYFAKPVHSSFSSEICLIKKIRIGNMIARTKTTSIEVELRGLKKVSNLAHYANVAHHDDICEP
jgi:hypothetical protein